MKEQPTILLVDDEPDFTKNIAPVLERAGFAVMVAADGEVALRYLHSHTADLIVLDVVLPKVNGREVLRQLREAGNWTPVILLSQYGDASERAMTLMEGADDYLNKKLDYLDKPFDPQELIARIRAVLRRASAPHPPPLQAKPTRLVSGELQFDLKSRRVWLGTQELALRPRARTLLEYLMIHPDEVISRDRLLDEVWGYTTGIIDRAVDARIYELRHALKDDVVNPRYIRTMPGHGGYCFIGPVEGVP